MPKPVIEFVYFDLGNILLSFDPRRATRNVADRFGVPEQKIAHVVYESGLQVQWEHGRVDAEAFAQQVRASLGVSRKAMPTHELHEALSDMFVAIESMPWLVRRVREAGYRIGLLSNTCPSHWEWVLKQDYDVFKVPMDITIVSFEVDSMKPDPRIYEVAEQKSGVNPQSILFIDDRPENVNAARLRGWHAVQCLGGQQAVAVLEQYLDFPD